MAKDAEATAASAELEKALAEVAKLATRLEETRASEEERIARAETTAALGGGLAAKWAAILGKLDAIPRNGHAEITTKSGTTYSYDYVLESDLMAALRPLLAEYGIAAFYSDEILDSTSLGSGWYETRVRVTLVLVDGRTGEREILTADDSAADYGDKAARKAKTGAVRYLLLKGTLNPSDATDDPDAPENAVERPKAEPERSKDDASQTTSRRRAPSADRPEKLRKRVVELANEYDEVAEGKPGETLGALVADVGSDLPTWDEEWLVFAGKSLGEALTLARAARQDGHAVEPFRLPETDRPVPF